MGVDTSKWGESQYESAAVAVGLPASNFVPQSLRSIASSVAQNSVPSKAPSTFVTACTASLICRGIIYFKSNPGDCGSPTGLDLENAQLTGLAGNAASAGLSVASKIAGAASGISGIAGAALPGIGIAVQVLTQIFANHAAAVADEQTTICKVALLINQVIPFMITQSEGGCFHLPPHTRGCKIICSKLSSNWTTFRNRAMRRVCTSQFCKRTTRSLKNTIRSSLLRPLRHKLRAHHQPYPMEHRDNQGHRVELPT